MFWEGDDQNIAIFSFNNGKHSNILKMWGAQIHERLYHDKCCVEHDISIFNVLFALIDLNMTIKDRN